MFKKMLQEKKFAMKISFFNSLGFAFAVGIPTFVDPLLRSHVRFGSREYFLGPWVLLISLLVFILTYSCIVKSSRHKYFFSWFPLAVLGIAVLWNFRPELPHANVTMWIFGYCLTSFVASWIQHAPIEFKFASDDRININARLERVKETISQWRTISISIATGYLAIIIPWSGFLWFSTNKMVTDPGEQFIASLSQIAQMIAFSLYVFVGPVFEAFSKYFSASDGLLKIKEPMED